VDKVLILQSFRPLEVPGWIDRCQASVQAWAVDRGYDYLSVGDELFERLPDWYALKVAPRKPIAADLARLLWIFEKLQTEEHDVVAWFDADVYVFAPELLSVAPQTSCVFGGEYWLDEHDKTSGLRIHKNVHNAYCAFRGDCPILTFLIEAIQRMVRRVDPAFIAPQFVGPKLLTSLHNIVGFELEPGVGAISPFLAQALINDDMRVLNYLSQALPQPMLAANLCLSLHADTSIDMNVLLDVLALLKNGLK